MFDLLFASKVNDDAVRLKTHLNLMAARYLHMPIPQLRDAIRQDYGQSVHVAQDTDGEVTVEFSHPDLPNFKIWIEGKAHLKLNVQGRKNYRGFLLTVSGEGRTWTIRTAGEEAEHDARKLAHILERKFSMHVAKR